jgi:L-cystine uptake protein TcyP (sodium:dicarboxylate symporter family)
MILVIFNNISVISCRSVLLWEETRVPEKTTACQKSLTNSCIPLRAQRLKLATFAVIHTDSIDSCKSNYHTITTKTACICKWYIMFVIVFSVHFFSFGTVGVMQDRTKYVYLLHNICSCHKTTFLLCNWRSKSALFSFRKNGVAVYKTGQHSHVLFTSQ